MLAASEVAADDTLAPFDRVLDMLCVDLIDEIGCERVFLLTNEDDDDVADLLILPNALIEGTTPILAVEKALWRGGMFGDGPYLGTTDSGALTLTEELIGSGRNPFINVYTIVERGGVLTVAGHTYSTYDRLDNSTFGCDVNLLTGGYNASATPPQIDLDTDELINDDRVFEQSGRGDVGAFALADLDYQNPWPEICRTNYDLFFER